MNIIISYHLLKSIIIVQVWYITIEANAVFCNGYYEFLFPNSYSGEGLVLRLFYCLDSHVKHDVRDLAVLASFISMDLINENLTFHGILMFSILKLSHPVTNALALLSFLVGQKLHVLFSSFPRSSSPLSWKRKKYRFKSLNWNDQGLHLRWTTFKAIMLTITQLMWFRCLLYLFS